jgi:hypothetical protein
LASVDTVTAIDPGLQGLAATLVDVDAVDVGLDDFDVLGWDLLCDTDGDELDDDVDVERLVVTEGWALELWVFGRDDVPVAVEPPPPRMAPQTHDRMSRTRTTTATAITRRTQ